MNRTLREDSEPVTPDTDTTPRPLTPEQISGHARPSFPQIAPDGDRILYTVRQISKSGEHQESAIWIVSVDDGEATQYSSGLAFDDEPRWSPDGARVAFISDRAERGKATVYVMPAGGGEAVRAFDQDGDMDTLMWSPDGTRLSVLMTEPETDEEKKRNEERDDASVWDTDYKFQRLWVIDPATRKGRCVSPPGRQVLTYAWSADSLQIAICTTPTPRIDDIFKQTQLAVVTRDGGEPRTVCEPYSVAADPVWSADGNHIAWIGPAGRVANGDCVYSVSAEGGDPVCLTPDFPGTVETLVPIGDREKLLVQASAGMHTSLHSLTWDGHLQSLNLPGDSGSIPMPVTVSRDGANVAGIWESGRSAPDVWVWDTRIEGDVSRRTHLNEELEQAAIGDAEVVRWSNGDVDEIEGMLFKPYGYDPQIRYPLVVQIHGGPTSRWADEFTATWHDWAHALAGRGFAVLLPNPRGSTGRGPEFSNAIYNDVGGGEYRDMITGVEAMIERGIADPDRLGVGGWSWGGYMTAWTISQTTRFKAAIVGAGLPNMVSDNGIGDIPTANLSYFEKSVYQDPEPYWERSAIRYLRNVNTPTLILHGEADQRVAMPQGLELYTGLRSLGVETRFVTYPREPHGIQETNHQKDLIERVIDWYTKHLKD